MSSALRDLVAGNKPAKKPVVNKKEKTSIAEEKVSRSIRMRESTFSLLKKVTNRIEEETGKFTQEDAIFEGLSLLAKKKGLEL